MFRVKGTKSSVLCGDGPDAAAAIAMAIPAGNWQTVPHGDLTGIWVFGLNEEFIEANAAIQVHPFEGFLQCTDGVQRVFQTVGFPDRWTEWSKAPYPR